MAMTPEMTPEHDPTSDGHGLDRRTWLRRTSAAAAAVVAAPMINLRRYQLFAQSRKEYSARAIAIMQRATVIDMLGVFTLDFAAQAKWMADPDTFPAAHFEKMKSSGINVFHPAIGLGGGVNAYEQALRWFAEWNSFIAGNSSRFMRIDAAGDFADAKAAGKIGVLLGLQNAAHFRRPDDVDAFRSIGQMVAQLTYNSRNLIGNGATERRDDGLSDFGVAIVERMNKVGMAVDVSHCGDRTTLDAFEVSKKPVLITHSNCRALVPGHPRVKTDEAIRAMAKSGGVMGITGVRMFVKNDEPTTIEHALDHFDHVAKLVGPEYLGVGSDIDLDGYDDMPAETNKQLRASYKGSYGFREKIDIEGIDHPQRMFDLTDGLIRRKYSDANIEGILGGNFKRVLTGIWAR
jgi:membrane dipeptidase